MLQIIQKVSPHLFCYQYYYNKYSKHFICNKKDSRNKSSKKSNKIDNYSIINNSLGEMFLQQESFATIITNHSNKTISKKIQQQLPTTSRKNINGFSKKKLSIPSIRKFPVTKRWQKQISAPTVRLPMLSPMTYVCWTNEIMSGLFLNLFNWIQFI